MHNLIIEPNSVPHTLCKKAYHVRVGIWETPTSFEVCLTRGFRLSQGTSRRSIRIFCSRILHSWVKWETWAKADYVMWKYAKHLPSFPERFKIKGLLQFSALKFLRCFSHQLTELSFEIGGEMSLLSTPWSTNYQNQHYQEFFSWLKTNLTKQTYSSRRTAFLNKWSEDVVWVEDPTSF